MKRIKKLTFSAKIAIIVALVIVVATIFLTFINAGFDPTKVGWIKWVERIVVNIMLGTAMMFAGETSYMGYIMTKDDGKYQHLLGKYNEAKEQILNKTQYLDQYLDIQYEKAVKMARYEYLVNHGVENARMILELDIQDIRWLDKPYEKEINGKKVVFKSHTSKQIEAIKYVLEGKVIVKKVSKYFYLDKDNNTIGVNTYQQAQQTDDERKRILRLGRITKIVSMVMVSAILAGFIIDSVENSADTWTNLLSRLMSCVGGYWAGTRNSARANEIDCKALSIKTTLLIEYFNFLNEKPDYFKMTDEEYSANQEMEEYKKRVEKVDVVPVYEDNGITLIEQKE